MVVPIKQEDLETLFDETNYIIPHEVDCAAREDRTLIKVIYLLRQKQMFLYY